MKKKAIIPQGTDTSATLFAPGVQVGDLLYTSGMVGVKDGELVGEDIESQARQALENLGVVLEAAGTTWENVVKLNCFLAYPRRDFAGWNTVYKTFFSENPPARTTIGGTAAMEGALIEIDLVVVI